MQATRQLRQHESAVDIQIDSSMFYHGQRCLVHAALALHIFIY